MNIIVLGMLDITENSMTGKKRKSFFTSFTAMIVI